MHIHTCTHNMYAVQRRWLYFIFFTLLERRGDACHIWKCRLDSVQTGCGKSFGLGVSKILKMANSTLLAYHTIQTGENNPLSLPPTLPHKGHTKLWRSVAVPRWAWSKTPGLSFITSATTATQKGCFTRFAKVCEPWKTTQLLWRSSTP